MQTVTLSEGDKPYTVTACVVLCGKDIAEARLRILVLQPWLLPGQV